MDKPGLLFDPGTAVRKDAVLSPCGLYRYALWRTWDEPSGWVNFILLNPSTADAGVDDPTIRRCIGFARSWGYGVLMVTNLYAFRATHPKDLWKATDPIGPDNDLCLRVAASACDLVVCAWGNGGAPVWREKRQRWERGRGLWMLQKLEEWGIKPQALRITGHLMPEHPLRLPGHLTPQPWEAVPKPEALWRPAGFVATPAITETP